LDCFPLSETAVVYEDGKPGPKTTREVLYLIPGEPSASLFLAPATYVERSTSEFADEFARRTGGLRPFSDAVQQRAEQKYQERKVR
jgi:hypothetical protein